MRILITGAGGFLGFALARRLLERGHEIHGFSRGNHPRLQALGVVQHRGDLADGDALSRAAEGCEQVYHVAARPGAWGPFRDYHRANVLGTENVLAACRRHRIPELVYTSTPSVVSRGTDLEGVDESLGYPTRFKAHYPATKARAEQLVRAAHSQDLRTLSLRPHLVWGPGDTSLMPRIVARAKAGKLRRIGAVEKRIDTTYIDDAVDAHLLAGEVLGRRDLAPAGSGPVYFISSGQPIGTWTMIDRMLAAAGLPPVHRRISRASARVAGALAETVYRLGRVTAEPPITRWVAEELSTAHWFDISAARRDLGFAPKVTLDEGMERLATWWRDRP